MKGNVNAKVINKNVKDNMKTKSNRKISKKRIKSKLGKKTFYVLIAICILLMAQLSVVIYAINENGSEETDNIINNMLPPVGTRNGMPDLICTIESEYGIEYTDHDSAVIVTITNIGEAEINGEEIWLIVDKDGEIIFEEMVTDILGIDESVEVIISWVSRIEKDYLWEATVDPDNLIEESNEDNNYVAVTIGVLNMHSNTGYENYYHYVGEESKIMREHNTLINSIDGNLYLYPFDLHVNAFQFDLDIKRVYNSQRSHILSPMGYGWTFNHDTHLQIQGNGDVIYIDMDGSSHYYTLSGGSYIPPTGEYDKLTLSTDFYWLYMLDGSVQKFSSSSGNILQIIDKNSNILTYTYNTNQLVVSDTSGLSLTITYSGGQVTQVTDPISRVVSYGYSNQELTSVTDPRGNSMGYTYHSGHLLDTYTDREGTTLSFTYKLANGQGRDRVHEVTRGDGGTGSFKMYTFTYYAFKTLIDNADDVTTTIEYNIDGNPTHMEGPVVGKSFREGDMTWVNGKRTSYTDLRSYTTIYINDEYGNKLSKTDPLGYTYRWEYNVIDIPGQYISLKTKEINRLNNEWIYNYDSSGNLLDITDPTGYIRTMTYYMTGLMNDDSGPPHITFQYDTHGNLWKETFDDITYIQHTYNMIGWETSTLDEDRYTAQYIYDNNGNILTITDPLGNIIRYTYDRENRVTSKTNRLGYITYYFYDDLHWEVSYIEHPEGYMNEFDYDDLGNLIEHRNKNGKVTNFEYDDLNRIIVERDAYGNTKQWTYDTASNVVSETNKNGAITEYEYDATNRRTDVIDPFNHVTTTIYDAEGQKIEEINGRGFVTTYEYDAAGRFIIKTDALGNSETKTYDSQGRLSEETAKDGSTRSYTYDVKSRVNTVTDTSGITTYSYDGRGNKLTEIDPLDRMTSFTFDGLSRTLTVTTPMPYITTFNYDAEGNIVGIQDPNGNSITFTYDKMNREKTETTQMGKLTTYKYDGEGNIIERVDPKNDITTYTYDDLNRRTKVSYPDTTYISYDYDPEGNVVMSHNEGIGAGETMHFTYDEKNQLKSVRAFKMSPAPGSGFDLTIEYEYDEVGNKIEVRDPEGGITRYQYDGLDRMVSIVNPLNEITTFEYDEMSRWIYIGYANGMTLTNIYSSCSCQYGKLIDQKYTKSDGTTLLQIFYTYDTLGKVLTRTDSSGTTTYGYDNDDRLNSVVYPGGSTVTYTYDGAGNRLTMVVNGVTTTYTYNNDNELLMITGGGTTTTFSYDNNGNVITKVDASGTTTYSYDYENRLVEILFPDSTSASYIYCSCPPQLCSNCIKGCGNNKIGTDVGGKRFCKTTTSGMTYYFYDDEDIILEYDGSFVLQARYTHGPGIDNQISMYRGGQSYFYLKDKLGSIVAIADQNENIVKTYTYDAWGSITAQSGSLTNSYTYTGREYDSESGLYYYRARYYNSIIGRFMQRDPEGVTDGLNMYIYVHNNPTNEIDPTGKFSVGMSCCRKGGRYFGIPYCKKWGTWHYEDGFGHWEGKWVVDGDWKGFVGCIGLDAAQNPEGYYLCLSGLRLCWYMLVAGPLAVAICLGATCGGQILDAVGCIWDHLIHYEGGWVWEGKWKCK